MTMARRTIVREGEPGVYHCINRCVRRAFLCGYDEYSQKDYNHRKGWIAERLQELSGIFGLEVYAYAVMSNHQHVVLRVAPNLTADWTAKEVVQRWHTLFPGERDPAGKPVPLAESVLERRCQDEAQVKQWRERLGNVSWFMRCLNEPIARRANREDGCTGRFWSGRFKCQRLEDEGAVLACMAYVDLNPVRAGLTERPETSEFTSVYDRIVARNARARISHMRPEGDQALARLTLAQKKAVSEVAKQTAQDAWLSPLDGLYSGASQTAIEIDLEGYLELVDYTGRCVKEGKLGCVPDSLLPILKRLELDDAHWVNAVKSYGSLYYRVAGKAEKLSKAALQAGQKWFQASPGSRLVYSSHYK